MKAVYTYNSAGINTGSRVVDDDYQLQAGETFTNPNDGNSGRLAPIHHIGDEAAIQAGTDSWQGATAEEHEAYVKQFDEQMKEQYGIDNSDNQPVQPSAQAQALNALGLQLANVEKQQATLAQAVNALGLQQAAASQKKNAQ